MLKDLRLCLEEARPRACSTEMVETTEGILAEADERGLGEQDFAALLEVVEERAGARLEPRAGASGPAAGGPGRSGPRRGERRMKYTISGREQHRDRKAHSRVDRSRR